MLRMLHGWKRLNAGIRLQSDVCLNSQAWIFILKEIQAHMTALVDH
uniref:Uncharacterized protein n=1 Tax=Arundo donax TaxID=35708 RepID=A0A0A9FN04_ARUDO